MNNNSPFPDPDSALIDPNGLLAAGADLSSQRLIQAYAKGIFPWYSPGEPILWWSPNPRTVFYIDNYRVHKSVKKTLRQHNLNVTLNTAFSKVITACAKPRRQENGIWITPEMIAAFETLYKQGHAHSVEIWKEKTLVGGIYGVATGNVFCGESMFSTVSNASKIALSCLIKYLQAFGFTLVDCQVENPHLLSLGAENIPRKDYIAMLSKQRQTGYPDMWHPHPLNWKKLLSEKNV